MKMKRYVKTHISTLQLKPGKSHSTVKEICAVELLNKSICNKNHKIIKNKVMHI